MLSEKFIAELGANAVERSLLIIINSFTFLTLKSNFQDIAFFSTCVDISRDIFFYYNYILLKEFIHNTSINLLMILPSISFTLQFALIIGLLFLLSVTTFCSVQQYALFSYRSHTNSATFFIFNKIQIPFSRFTVIRFLLLLAFSLLLR